MLTTCFNDTGRLNNDEFNRLVSKFHRLIHYYAYKYYLVGGESDDLYQWGLIGLYKAVLRYEENSEHSFNSIARVNIKNMMKSAITQANRQKHKLANEAHSLFEEKCVFNDGEGIQLIDTLVMTNSMEDPLTVVGNNDFMERILQLLNNCLTNNERKIMMLYMKGYKQGYISEILSIKPKIVDNAIQRSRKKLACYRSDL
jgi:RNA polymerase sporulation-specific sigma factor